MANRRCEMDARQTQNSMTYKTYILKTDHFPYMAGTKFFWSEERGVYYPQEECFRKNEVEGNINFAPEIPTLDSIIEQEINSFNPLYPDIKTAVRNSAESVAEKYLASFKQQLTDKLQKEKSSEMPFSAYSYNTAIDRCISLVND